MLVKVLNENGVPKYPIKDYIEDYVNDRGIDNIHGCTGKNVWEDYLEFCQEHNYPIEISSQSFRKRISIQCNLTSIVRKIDGKSVRVLVQKH